MEFSDDIMKIRRVLRNSGASLKIPEDFTVFRREVV